MAKKSKKAKRGAPARKKKGMKKAKPAKRAKAKKDAEARPGSDDSIRANCGSDDDDSIRASCGYAALCDMTEAQYGWPTQTTHEGVSDCAELIKRHRASLERLRDGLARLPEG
jgi:hypothetical protein